MHGATNKKSTDLACGDGALVSSGAICVAALGGAAPFAVRSCRISPQKRSPDFQLRDPNLKKFPLVPASIDEM